MIYFTDWAKVIEPRHTEEDLPNIASPWGVLVLHWLQDRTPLWSPTSFECLWESSFSYSGFHPQLVHKFESILNSSTPVKHQALRYLLIVYWCNNCRLNTFTVYFPQRCPTILSWGPHWSILLNSSVTFTISHQVPVSKPALYCSCNPLLCSQRWEQLANAFSHGSCLKWMML